MLIILYYNEFVKVIGYKYLSYNWQNDPKYQKWNRLYLKSSGFQFSLGLYNNLFEINFSWSFSKRGLNMKIIIRFNEFEVKSNSWDHNIIYLYSLT